MSGLEPHLLLRGYAAGIFPMADSRGAPEIFWVEPRSRAILPLDRFHLSRSLARRVRSGRFEVSRDRAFGRVLAACAERRETWINQQIERATLGLHAAGHAHSIETWLDGQLVGGLYGVKLGGAFFGESMFSSETDASKVALAWLVARLRVGDYSLLDCQFITDHLASMGAIEITQAQYLKRLAKAQLVAVSGASADGARTGAGTGADVAAGLAAEGFLPLPLAFAALLDAASAGSASPGKCIAQSFTHTS